MNAPAATCCQWYRRGSDDQIVCCGRPSTHLTPRMTSGLCGIHAGRNDLPMSHPARNVTQTETTSQETP